MKRVHPGNEEIGNVNRKYSNVGVNEAGPTDSFLHDVINVFRYFAELAKIRGKGFVDRFRKEIVRDGRKSRVISCT